MNDRSTVDPSSTVICAWCQEVLQVGTPDGIVTHGICARCAGESGFLEVLSLPDADVSILDRLPFGVIRLDASGRVTAYNQRESQMTNRTPESVLGRLFFTEVAPCAGVKAFQGTVETLRRSQLSDTTEFEFVFEFDHGSVLVLIQAIYNKISDTVTLIIRQQ